MPDRACATCAYVETQSNPHDLKHPICECRRYPPGMLLSGPGTYGGGFPPVKREWWCGEWAPVLAGPDADR